MLCLLAPVYSPDEVMNIFAILNYIIIFFLYYLYIYLKSNNFYNLNQYRMCK